MVNDGAGFVKLPDQLALIGCTRGDPRGPPRRVRGCGRRGGCRSTVARSPRPRVRRGRPDWGIDDYGKDGSGGPARRVTHEAPLMRLHGNNRAQWKRAWRSGAHRRDHCVRTDRPATLAASARDRLSAGTPRLFASPGLGNGGFDRLDLCHQRTTRPVAYRRRALLARSGRRPHTPAAARHRDHQPLVRCPPAGGALCPGQAPR